MMKTKKMLAILLALIMVTTTFAGCSNEDIPDPNADFDESSSMLEETPNEVVKTTGVVKEMSLAELVITLEDNTDVTLKAEGLEGLSDLALGDTIEVEYAKDNFVAAGIKVITKAEPESEGSEGEGSGEEIHSDSEDNSSVPDTQQSFEDTTGANAQSGTTTKDVNKMTDKQRAEAVFATGKIDITDWNTPAVEMHMAMNAYCFVDTQNNVLAFITSNVDNSSLDANGYGNYPNVRVSLVKAFNDYRGVKTTYIFDGNTACYLYDSKTDTFSETAFPSSSNDLSSSEEDNPTEGNKDKSNDTGDVYAAIDIINAERVKAGLNELKIDNDFMEMAAVRADECASVGSLYVDGKSHTRPDGSDWSTIFDEFDLKRPSRYYENGGSGTNRASAATQVEAWMNSSGHKANILKSDATRIGVGYASNGQTHFWIMISAS